MDPAARLQEFSLGSLYSFLEPGGFVAFPGDAAAPPGLGEPLHTGTATGSTRRTLSTKVPPGVPLPPRPQRKVVESMLADATRLNPKVAFKMLKQLGCPVRTVPAAPRQDRLADEAEGRVQCFIEVSYKEQPVMFQTLLEMGYLPEKSAEGALVVRVEQGQQRTQEELVAALSAPKRRKCPSSDTEEEDPKPKLSHQRETELVKRLAAPRQQNAAGSQKDAAAAEQAEGSQAVGASSNEAKQQATGDAAKRFKSVEEQKAHCERLSRRPGQGGLERQPRPIDSESGGAVASMGGLRVPAAASSEHIRPPRQPTSDSATKLGRSSSCGEAMRHAGLAAVRPSPRLAQAGMVSLSTPAASSSSSGSSAQVHVVDESGTSKSPEAETIKEDGRQDGQLPGRAHTSGTVRTSKDDTRSMLDDILGPMTWPGRPSEKRTQAQQREAAERLAKPREVPTDSSASEGASAVPLAARSAREQREICERLSAPRKPRPQQAQEEGQPLEESCADPDEGGTEVSGDARGADEEAKQVVTIPSMLAQCTGPLERIEEAEEDLGDASCQQRGGLLRPGTGGRAAASKRGQRARPGSASAVHSAGASTSSVSSTALAGPYAAPVVNLPPKPVAAPAGRPAAGRRSGPSRGSVAASSRPSRSSRLTSVNDETLQELVEYMLGAEDDDNSFFDDTGDDAAAGLMLGSIDRLYQELLETGNMHPKKGEASLPDIHSATDPSKPEPLQPEVPAAPVIEKADGIALRPERQPVEDAGVDAHEGMNQASGDGCETLLPSRKQELQFRELLEEVLWSALLLRRGASNGKQQDVGSWLLALVPAVRLAACREECGADGLTDGLLHRLSAELPEVHEALMQKPPPRRRGDLQRSPLVLLQALKEARDGLLSLACPSKSSPEEDSWVLMDGASEAPAPPDVALHSASQLSHRSLASQSGAGLDASDALSSAAATPSASGTSSTATSRRAKAHKPKRSSLSFWTPESFERLEATSRRAAPI